MSQRDWVRTTYKKSSARSIHFKQAFLLECLRAAVLQDLDDANMVRWCLSHDAVDGELRTVLIDSEQDHSRTLDDLGTVGMRQ